MVTSNDPYDRAAIASMSRLSHPLVDPARWAYAMRARAVLERTESWRRLGGNHRALGGTFAMLAGQAVASALEAKFDSSAGRLDAPPGWGAPP